jgi:hypothetical protein
MADIILRSAKGSNLTPNEVDSNFKNLNDTLMALQLTAGAGTVTSVAVNNLLGGVFNIDITGVSTINPTIRFRVTGSSGYVKSNGTALSTSATVPFSDVTGTVPVTQGGTGLTAIGSDNTFLSVEGSSLIYRGLTSPDGSINLSFGTSSLDVSVNQAYLDITAMAGTLPVNRGGTGAITAQAAINTLTAVSSATTGQILQKDGGGNVSWVTPSAGTGTVTNVSLSTTGISSVLSTSVTNPTTTPVISISVTGYAGYVKSNGSALSVSATVATSDLSGTVAIANGGTGQTTRQDAINALTDAAGGSTNNVLVRNSSSNAAWSSSLVLSDMRISNQRFVNNSVTLSPTDYFVLVDTRGGGVIITLPNPGSSTSPLEAGKTFIIKDQYGLFNSYTCIVSGLPTGIDGSSSFTMNTSYQCLEVVLVNDGGTKTWAIKSNYKNT